MVMVTPDRYGRGMSGDTAPYAPLLWAFESAYGVGYNGLRRKGVL